MEYVRNMLLLKGLNDMSANDFESIWLCISEQLSQRRGWIDELDAKLSAVEDTRVDRV